MPNVLVAPQPAQSIGPPSPTCPSPFDPLKEPYLSAPASLMPNLKPPLVPLDGSKHAVSDPGPSSHNHGYGLRAQLHHLLPRHTWFHVRVQIHQLTNVPLISGEFGVRWKFKGVHAVPGTRRGILGMVKGKSRVTSAESQQQQQQLTSMGSVKEDDANSEASPDSSSVMASTNSDSGHALPSPTVPPVNVLDDNNRNGSHPSSISQTSSTSSSDSKSLQDPSSSFSSTTATSASSSSRKVAPSLPPGIEYVPARGVTSFARLRDHTVRWEHTLDIIVRMDVERDTLDLLPNELKLVVMQRIIPDDITGAPSNPRFGALYLNLAEYASAGVVTRRYLLSESKTNATLKLTIQLENVGGETNWKAPPLPKGEILSGIAGLLDSDVYRTRPRQLDLYGPYYSKEDLGLDLGVERASHESCREATDSTVRGFAEGGSEESTTLQADSMSSSMLSTVSGSSTVASGTKPPMSIQPKAGCGFEVGKLPTAYGPKSTEALIEALFNPSLTMDSRKESPFTILVTPGTIGRTAGGDVGGSHLEMLKEQHRRGTSLGARSVAGASAMGDVASLYSVASSEETSASAQSSSAKSAMSRNQREGRLPVLDPRPQHQHQQSLQHHQEGYLGVDDHGVMMGVVPRSLTMGSAMGEGGLLGEGAANGGAGVKGWWKKVSSISRPSTPTPVR